MFRRRPRLRGDSKPALPLGATRPKFVVDVEIANGGQLVERLRAQGVAPDEVVFKYFWPRYAPPPEAGILSLLKSESLSRQFERLLEMHRVIPSGIPLPVGMVRNEDGETVGYLLERVEGVTFRELIEVGAHEEARRRLEVVERNIAKLHAKKIAHGDLNASNIIASDDGRTLLIDTVGTPGPGTMLQDEVSLGELRAMIP